jgi:ABC-type transport system involved in multi-copper enzyme maturation permease subunit
VSSTIAVGMVGADFLKLRKKRSTLLWALVLAFLPVIIFLVANGIEKESPHFSDGLNVLARLFGLLAAILIGVEAGTTDASNGVFRDLVVTGRSRLALFASRVPAALALCWLVIVSAYLLLIVGTFALTLSGSSTPDASLILNSLGFTLLSTGVVCTVAVGFSSLTASKPGAIIALIAWQIVASPLIVAIESLGSARDGVLTQALTHFSPVGFEGGHHGGTILTMSTATALLVLVAWLVVFLGLGAWRTRTMDA